MNRATSRLWNAIDYAVAFEHAGFNDAQIDAFERYVALTVPPAGREDEDDVRITGGRRAGRIGMTYYKRDPWATIQTSGHHAITVHRDGTVRATSEGHTVEGADAWRIVQGDDAAVDA
jgi:hypothetical protein